MELHTPTEEGCHMQAVTIRCGTAGDAPMPQRGHRTRRLAGGFHRRAGTPKSLQQRGRRRTESEGTATAPAANLVLVSNFQRRKLEQLYPSLSVSQKYHPKHFNSCFLCHCFYLSPFLLLANMSFIQLFQTICGLGMHSNTMTVIPICLGLNLRR